MVVPKKILICGPTMIDFNVKVDPDLPADRALMQAHGYTTNGKRTIDQAESDRLMASLHGRQVMLAPGGTMPNTAITTKSVLGDQADMTFLGLSGNDDYGKMIRESFAKAEIALEPKDFPASLNPQCGLSYCVDPQGKHELGRSFATYPGNAAAIFHPDNVPNLEQLVQTTDIVMLSGSALEKIHPDMAHRLLEHRWNHGKTLVLSLPVNPEFAAKHSGYFQWLIPSANVILSNEEELQYTYRTDSPQQARECLQREMQKHQLDIESAKESHQRPWKGERSQVGFVTAGKEGAYIITADEIKKIDCLPFTGKKMHLSGAGDTAFAGFMLGYLNGLPHESSARIAMELANEKLNHEGPRIPDPQSALKMRMPKIAEALYKPRNACNIGEIIR